MSGVGIQCMACKNRLEDTASGEAVCKAFPKSIPMDFYTGERSHLAQVEGDGGIHFETDDHEVLAELKESYAMLEEENGFENQP